MIASSGERCRGTHVNEPDAGALRFPVAWALTHAPAGKRVAELIDAVLVSPAKAVDGNARRGERPRCAKARRIGSGSGREPPRASGAARRVTALPGGLTCTHLDQTVLPM